jgi:hypothetical protein
VRSHFLCLSSRPSRLRGSFFDRISAVSLLSSINYFVILSRRSFASLANFKQPTLRAMPLDVVTAPSGTLPDNRSAAPTILMQVKNTFAARAALKL